MKDENKFIYVWRGWSIGMTSIFLPIAILFNILAPESRPEMWLSIVMIPVIAMGQGLMIAGGVLLGNKIWSLKNIPNIKKT
tara:strand:+ start:268 stop:510 length:243 start_codon:yes stop_codon:yes gene_type:complete